MARYRDFDAGEPRGLYKYGGIDFYVSEVTWDEEWIFSRLQTANKSWLERWSISNAETPGLGRADFGIWERDIPVGQITLWDLDLENKTAKLSYWVSENCSSRGIMSRSLVIVFDHCFSVLGLTSVTAPIQPNNYASIKVAEKLRMQQIGRKSYKTFEGKLVEHIIYKKEA